MLLETLTLFHNIIEVIIIAVFIPFEYDRAGSVLALAGRYSRIHVRKELCIICLCT